MNGQPSFTATDRTVSNPPPQGHREHLRSLWIGLVHTHRMIESGAAAFAESVKLLDSLNGHATDGQP